MAAKKKKKASTARSDKPRWLYRFGNFKKAFKLLSAAVDIYDERELSSLEEEGLIQRFEYKWELAWKLLQDLLDAEGVTLDTRTPRSVIRAAHKAKFITNAVGWMDALDARNRMAHTYDEADFEAVIEEIRETYLGLFGALHRLVSKKEASL